VYIHGDFATGTSQLEGCYGIGMDRDSKESTMILGGNSGSFEINEMEAWLVVTVQ
jgi:hypothetical protein